MNSPRTFALPVLLLGAVGIGFAPIFVRLSEIGPVATAFYRLLFAVPILWIWAQVDSRNAARNNRSKPKTPGRAGDWKWIVLAGCCFAGDLALWHWSILLTSVANATLFTNFAPIFVTIGAWFLFRERITRMFLFGLAFAMAGAVILIGVSFGAGPHQVWGDVLGLLTAVFYAGYILSIKQVRRLFSTSVSMMWSGVITCAVLFLIAFLTEDSLLAATLYGWGVLVALALVSHVGGQALIAYSLAHLPASFASVGLLLQPVAAAVFAWLILKEALGLGQGVGGVLVLAGIYFAWKSMPVKTA